MTIDLTDIRDLDFSRFVRDGDTVIWGQACAEPLSLTERLMEQRHEIGTFRCFIGVSLSNTIRPEYADCISFFTYCGTGNNRNLIRSGVLDIIPCHYSRLPELLCQGPFRADVVLLQLPPANISGGYSLGLASDYTSTVVNSARIKIAEINDQIPRTEGPLTLSEDQLDVIVHSSRAPVSAPFEGRSNGSETEQIAANVASLIEDGATLQVGIGSLPEAILGGMIDHANLGMHSGVLGDAGGLLMEAGVITNDRKTLDRGHTVAGLLMGTQRLFRFAEENPTIHLRDTRYIHDPEILAAQDNLIAINSAIEVDLTGQVNSEVVGSDYVGAVGGAVDFLRGAARSRGGIPIIALPSTTANQSRIVPNLSGPTSISRSDAGVIVTEYGVADLRGRSLQERSERLRDIAHPDHQGLLEDFMEGR